MIHIAAVLLTFIALPAARANATEPPDKNSAAQSICLMIESAAGANHIPLEFFARVIWQESRFRSDAVGPVTRSGERALGIAKFMPRTAAERGLLDPFDPVQALPKAAEFLRELRAEFGNLGLAAGGLQRRSAAAARLSCRQRRHARRDPCLCRRDHRDDGRRLGRDARARPRTQARARLQHVDGAAQPLAQSICSRT